MNGRRGTRCPTRARHRAWIKFTRSWSRLGLKGTDDELGFELSLGGSSFQELDRAFFWNRFGAKPGAAIKVEAWHILSPIRPRSVDDDPHPAHLAIRAGPNERQRASTPRRFRERDHALAGPDRSTEVK